MPRGCSVNQFVKHKPQWPNIALGSIVLFFENLWWHIASSWKKIINYSGVPTKEFIMVSSDDWTYFANPKSVNLNVLPWRRIFAGLISRWMIPISNNSFKPRSNYLKMANASASESNLNNYYWKWTFSVLNIPLSRLHCNILI
jgi:hypothetical protein